VLNTENFTDNYILGEFLGKGHFGSVNECTLKSNQEVKRAVKILSKIGPKK
jgi:hypothetical protein